MRKKSEVDRLAHFPLPVVLKNKGHLLPKHPLSAPNSPKLTQRKAIAITVTSSAKLDVDQDKARSASSSRVPEWQAPSRRPRSRSPNPKSALSVQSGSHVSRASGRKALSGSSSGATERKSSPSPTRRARSPNMAARRIPGRSLNTGSNRSFSADPGMNDPAIKAKIGNRATKTVNKSMGNCGVCKRQVVDEGCTAFGKVYHKDCFKCTVCRQKISGKFYEKNGKPYCPKDFAKLQDECCICKQPILGDSVELAKKTYHPECCKCYICGDTIRGRYYAHQGMPICEVDFKHRAEKCSVCGEVILGTCYTVGDKMLCEEHFNAKSEICPRCEKKVSGNEMVRTSDAGYHKACFTCVECKKSLEHDPFISDDKKNIYCEEDYNKKKAMRCTTCKQPIVPKPGEKTVPRLRALGKDFHLNCFKCEDCGVLLESRVKGKECYPWRNHILCLKCNRKKISSDEDSTSDDDH